MREWPKPDPMWSLGHALKEAGWAAASGVQPKRSLAAFERRVAAFKTKTLEEAIRAIDLRR